MKYKKETRFTRVYNRLTKMSMKALRYVVSCMPAGWSFNEADDCIEIVYNGQVKGLDDVARSIIRNRKEWILD